MFTIKMALQAVGVAMMVAFFVSMWIKKGWIKGYFDRPLTMTYIVGTMLYVFISALLLTQSFLEAMICTLIGAVLVLFEFILLIRDWIEKHQSDHNQ